MGRDSAWSDSDPPAVVVKLGCSPGVFTTRPSAAQPWSPGPGRGRCGELRARFALLGGPRHSSSSRCSAFAVKRIHALTEYTFSRSVLAVVSHKRTAASGPGPCCLLWLGCSSCSIQASFRLWTLSVALQSKFTLTIFYPRSSGAPIPRQRPGLDSALPQCGSVGCACRT